MINKLLGELFWDELSLRLSPVFQHRDTIKLSKTAWGNQRISLHSVLLLMNNPHLESNRGIEYNKTEVMEYFNNNFVGVKNSMLFHIESILGQDDKPCVLDRQENLEIIYQYWSRIYNLSCSAPKHEPASQELMQLCLDLYR